MSAPSSTPKNFPKIYGGPRKRLIHRLLLNGAAQGAVAFALAHALRIGLASAHRGRIDRSMVAIMITAGVAIFCLRILESADTERLGQDYVMRVRLRLFKRIVAQPVDAMARGGWGATMARMIGDLNALRNWVAIGVARASVAAVTLIGLLIALLLLSPVTGAVAAAAVALYLSVATALTPLLRRRVREARRHRGRLANNLVEKLFAHGTVRHLGRTRDELSRVRSQSRRLRDVLVRRARTAQIIRTLPESALPLAIAAVVALTALETRGPTEAPVAILLLGMLMRSLSRLGRAWDYRVTFAEGRRRIGVALAGPHIDEDPNARPLAGTEPLAVAVDGLRIGALGPLSFAAKPGDVVHVRGASGTGKSTLMLSIARLLEPVAGEIRLDGRPLRSVNLDSLYESVQLVAPGLPLLRGTVADNVGYGKASTTDAWSEAVASACRLIDDPALPEGLDTRIEAQGKDLPGGLRARIALARAASMRPRLLLIDDPAFVADATAHEALSSVCAMLRTTVLFASDRDATRLSPTRTWHLPMRRPLERGPELKSRAIEGRRAGFRPIFLDPTGS